jgi:serine phosphatase RsbU (regulator of sigma subunit)
MFGARGALDFVRRQQRSAANEIVHGIYRAARAFAGGAPQLDDILSVVCKVE